MYAYLLCKRIHRYLPRYLVINLLSSYMIPSSFDSAGQGVGDSAQAEEDGSMDGRMIGNWALGN